MLSGRLPLAITLPLVVLIGLGTILVYSVSPVSGPQDGILWRLGLRLGLGVVALVLMWRIPTSLLRQLAPWIFLATILLLIAVLIPGIGVVRGGARRWIALGPIGFQPSEVAKLGAVIALSAVLARREEGGNQMSLWVPVVVMHIPVALIVVSDLGTALVAEFCLGVLIFAAGLPWRALLWMGLGTLPVLWSLLMGASFRRERLMAFLDPWAYRYSGGYQVTESLISFGSGGLWGRGVGGGKHALLFLPEAHNDFVFSVLGQELGFVGVLTVLLISGCLIIALLRLAIRCEVSFLRFLCLGIASMIGAPMLFHMAVNLGLVPVKGLPFTFVSYGGSNLLVAMAATGIVFRIAHEQTSEAGG